METAAPKGKEQKKLVNGSHYAVLRQVPLEIQQQIRLTPSQVHLMNGLFDERCLGVAIVELERVVLCIIAAGGGLSPWIRHLQ